MGTSGSKSFDATVLDTGVSSFVETASLAAIGEQFAGSVISIVEVSLHDVFVTIKVTVWIVLMKEG